MNKQDILLELNKLEYDILALAYLPDDDGLDPNGNPIIRQVYQGLEEKDLRMILDEITELVGKIRESE